ncbi:MAG: hypothetical protein GY874_16775 [Desulfobacteraceae bacterium]|nr:hypothetical protein [Desulfobacteraceae bacterium]
MQIIETIALISINETLLFQLVSFLLFFVLLNKIMIRPIRDTISQRQDFMDTIEQDIKSADNTYEEIAAQIKDEEASVKQAASKIRKQLETEGHGAAAELIGKTRYEIQVLRFKAQQETEEKIVAARESIQAEAKTIADLMIASLLEKRSAS